MNRDKKLFIKDIIENIDLVLSSTEKLNKKDFIEDKNIVDATIRRLEIIGEAVKNLPIDFMGRYPEVPWSDIAGFRDVMIHGYFKVDLDKVWNIIEGDFPDLKQKIEKIKKELKKEGDEKDINKENE